MSPIKAAELEARVLRKTASTNAVHQAERARREKLSEIRNKEAQEMVNWLRESVGAILPQWMMHALGGAAVALVATWALGWLSLDGSGPLPSNCPSRCVGRCQWSPLSCTYVAP